MFLISKTKHKKFWQQQTSVRSLESEKHIELESSCYFLLSKSKSFLMKVIVTKGEEAHSKTIKQHKLHQTKIWVHSTWAWKFSSAEMLHLDVRQDFCWGCDSTVCACVCVSRFSLLQTFPWLLSSSFGTHLVWTNTWKIDVHFPLQFYLADTGI